MFDHTPEDPENCTPRRIILHPSSKRELDHLFTSESGWAYCTEDDANADRVKINHYAIRGDTYLEIDWVPYTLMTIEDFELWFALGAPVRQGPRCLNGRDLKHLASRKLRRAA